MRGLSLRCARVACMPLVPPLTARRGRCGWPLEVWRLFGSVVCGPIMCVLSLGMIALVVLLVLWLTGALAKGGSG